MLRKTYHSQEGALAIMLVIVVLTTMITAGITIATLRTTRLQFLQDREEFLSIESIAATQRDQLLAEISETGSEQQIIDKYYEVTGGSYDANETNCEDNQWKTTHTGGATIVNFEYCLRRVGYVDNKLSSVPKKRDVFEIRARANSGSPEEIVAKIELSVEAPYASFVKIAPAALAVDDRFGSSVAIDGDRIAVGAPSDLPGETGKTFVLDWNSASDTWGSQLLTPSESEAFQRFGLRLDIDGDWLAVGAPLNDYTDPGPPSTDHNDAGTVYMFQRQSNDTWLETEMIQPTSGGEALVGGDTFGQGVALWGDWLAVGVPGRNSDEGSVYMYELQGSSWVFHSEIGAPASESMSFGESVALYNDLLAVGAPQKTISGSSAAGVVYMYLYNAGTDIWEATVGIDSNTPWFGYNFGSSVDLHKSRLVVGERSNDNIVSNNGAAHVFTTPDGLTWPIEKEIFAHTQAIDDYFGQSVGVYGNVVAVGATEPFNPSDGFATIHEKDSSFAEDTYFERVRLPDIYTTLQADNKFGISVAISENRLVVGASEDDETANAAGAVYIYDR